MEVKEPVPKYITKQMMTAEEYLEWEPKQLEKHEYHGGEIVDMSGASLPHNYIQANLFGESISIITVGFLIISILSSTSSGSSQTMVISG